MKILEHFNITQLEADIDCVLLKLNSEEKDIFLSKLPDDFRKCYVTDKKLKNNISKLRLSKKEIIQSYIPKPGNVMSGEFGEIISYFLLKEKYLPLELRGPKKWRSKIDSERPIQYSDIVLFYKKDASKPSKDDLIVTAESKMKATRDTRNHPIQNALNGSIDDSTRRLAITLTWLRERAIKKSKQNNIDYLDRFIKPVAFGAYKKDFKAIAIIDMRLLDDEIEKDLDTDNCVDDLELIIITMDNLKAIYEETYQSIPETV